MKTKTFLAIWPVLMVLGCEPEVPTPLLPPKIETLAATNVTFHSAVIGGRILDLGNEPMIRKGIVWIAAHLDTPEEFNNSNLSIRNNVIEASDLGPAFTVLMDSLNPNQTYYFRAFAESRAGVAYGQKMKFTTKFETLTDIDGNVYRIWKIGNQTWTIDNFNATRLRDGTPIPNRTELSYWSSSAPKEPAMCWYNNNRAAFQKDHGALYNWYAASHPLIAPAGWRVPTFNDYLKLAIHLGAIVSGPNATWRVGGKLKMTGFDFWKAPNTGATNESLFSAKASGGVSGTHGFEALHEGTVFFTQEEDFNFGLTMVLLYNDNQLHLGYIYPKNLGFSLRLIKNE